MLLSLFVLQSKALAIDQWLGNTFLVMSIK